MQKQVNIKNKRARFEYELIDQYTAGIVLTGTEIKSIRSSKASIAESFCEFNDHRELFVINMSIETYSNGGYVNHRVRADRKLLLQKKELRKLHKEVKNVGLTIVPLNLFINEKGYANCELLLREEKRFMTKEILLRIETIKGNSIG